MTSKSLLVKIFSIYSGQLLAFFVLTSVLLVAIFPAETVKALPVVAQTTSSSSTCADDTDPSTCEAIETINNILNVMAAVVVPICGLIVVIGGIQYSVSGDKPEALSAARSRIYKAVLALIVFLSMWAFLKWLLPDGALQ